jgi:RNA polymerase sigma factor (sigma-70 family)
VPIRPNGAIRRQLRTLFNLGAIGELTDGQLLERFATQDGEAAELAFAALVERHGPMVLRVCRKALRDSNDVQDAFQATFLILVQKARSLWVRDSLGPWLHRVAHRVATRARSSAAGRREYERRAAAARPTLVSERGDREDLEALLHEEIDRLPERYRVPVVLCDLQGLTHEKAARHLGWPVGTVKTRLARARELLRDRLSRRGLGLPAGLLGAGKALGGVFRAVDVVLPGTLVEFTVRAAVPFAAGKALAVEVVSSRVAILIGEGLKTMFLTKLRMASAVLLLIGAAGAAGVLAQSGTRPGASRAQDQPPGPAVPVQVPAYITQSRVMIVTRLEEEVAEAQERLDRSLRKARSPDDPAVLHARKTFEDLRQRLDRIDQVLVDVVETYPTMVDFSVGPPDSATVESDADPRRNAEDARRNPAAASPDAANGAGRSRAAASPDAADGARRSPTAASPDAANGAGRSRTAASPDAAGRASNKDRAEWAKRMFDKGYVSKYQLDAELAHDQAPKARPQTGQPRQDLQQGGRNSQQPGPERGQEGQRPGQGQRSDSQRQRPGQGQQRQEGNSQGPSQGQQHNGHSQGQGQGQQGNGSGQQGQGQGQGQQGNGSGQQGQAQGQGQQGNDSGQQGQGQQGNGSGQPGQGQQGQGDNRPVGSEDRAQTAGQQGQGQPGREQGSGSQGGQG